MYSTIANCNKVGRRTLARGSIYSFLTLRTLHPVSSLKVATTTATTLDDDAYGHDGELHCCICNNNNSCGLGGGVCSNTAIERFPRLGNTPAFSRTGGAAGVCVLAFASCSIRS